MKETLSHYTDAGELSMVDVSAKEITSRTAAAHAFVAMRPEVLAALPQNKKATHSKLRALPGLWRRKRQQN